MNEPMQRTILISTLLFCIVPFASSQVATSISYKAKCEMCHGTSGLADTPQAKQLKVLSFSDPIVVADSDSTLVGIITNGSGKMPAYKGKLSDAEINSFIQFIRKVQNQQQ